MRVLPALCTPSPFLLAHVDPFLLRSSPVTVCSPFERAPGRDCLQPTGRWFSFSFPATLRIPTIECHRPSAEKLIAAFHALADGFRRKELVGQIGARADPAARDFLLGRLADPKETLGLRQAAAESLASREDVLAAQTLYETYRSVPYPGKNSPQALHSVLTFRQGVLRAMGALCDGSAREILFGVAEDETEKPEARRAALEALGETGDPHAVDALAGIAGGTAIASFRVVAVSALGKIGGMKAMQTLAALSKDARQPKTLRKAALSALGKAEVRAPLGEALGDSLFQALQSDDRAMRAAAARALDAAGRVSDVDRVMDALKTEVDPMVRTSLLGVLLKNPDERMMPLFERAARDSSFTHHNEKIRARALQAYCIYAGDSALETLTEIVQTQSDDRVLRVALAALSTIGGVRILPALLAYRAAANTRTWSGRARVKGLNEAIARFDGPEAVTAVLEAYPRMSDAFPIKDSVWLQAEVVDFLAKRKSDERVLPFLIDRLEAGNAGYYAFVLALDVLAQAADLRSFRLLRDIAANKKGPDPERAGSAFARRCRNRGDMLALLAEGDASERVFALKQLASLASPDDDEISEFLSTYLKKDPDPVVRGEIPRLLIHRTGARIIDAIADASRNDRDWKVRSQAGMALHVISLRGSIR